jgi:hypothetical protein
MMNKVNIPRVICYKLFGEVLKTATKLDSLVLVDVNGVKDMRVEHYADKFPSELSTVYLGPTNYIFFDFLVCFSD